MVTRTLSVSKWRSPPRFRLAPDCSVSPVLSPVMFAPTPPSSVSKEDSSALIRATTRRVGFKLDIGGHSHALWAGMVSLALSPARESWGNPRFGSTTILAPRLMRAIHLPVPLERSPAEDHADNPRLGFILRLVGAVSGRHVSNRLHGYNRRPMILAAKRMVGFTRRVGSDSSGNPIHPSVS